MRLFSEIKKRVTGEIQAGSNKFIVFPDGKVAEMVKTILKAEGMTYLSMDNRNQNADITNAEQVLESRYDEYKIIIAVLLEEIHESLLNQLKTLGVPNERIVDLTGKYFRDEKKDSNIFEWVDTIGIEDPRRGLLERCAREIHHRKVYGAVAEAGVYRGDFSKHINFWFPERKLYLIDTFEGFAREDVEVEVEKGFGNGEQYWGNTSVELILNKMPYPKKCIVKKRVFPRNNEGCK